MTQPINRTTETELLTADDVAEWFAVSKPTIRRWVRLGLFPPPHRFGRRLIRWRAADLERFLDEKGNRND